MIRELLKEELLCIWNSDFDESMLKYLSSIQRNCCFFHKSNQMEWASNFFHLYFIFFITKHLKTYFLFLFSKCKQNVKICYHCSESYLPF